MRRSGCGRRGGIHRSLLGVGVDAVVIAELRRTAEGTPGFCDRVRHVASGLSGLGVGPGERVAALARNDERTVVACLAATGIGAA